MISDQQSALSDSFQDNLLAAPVYTRPADYNGWKVPDILLSGHEAKIKEWELQQSLEGPVDCVRICWESKFTDVNKKKKDIRQ